MIVTAMGNWPGTGRHSWDAIRLMFVVLGIGVGLSQSGRGDDVDSIELFQPPIIHISIDLNESIESEPSSILPGYKGLGFGMDSPRKDGSSCASFEMHPGGGWPGEFRKKRTDLPVYPANDWLRQRFIENNGQVTGPLHKDDIVPMCAALYRVTTLGSNRPNDPVGSRIVLTKMGQAEWPAGITLDPFAYAITTGGKLSLPKVSQNHINPSLTPKYDEKSKSFSVTVFHVRYDQSFQLGGKSSLDGQVWRQDDLVIQKNSKMTVAVGSEYHTFRVVSIVPPDRDKHLPGWVEFRRVWPRITPFGTEEE